MPDLIPTLLFPSDIHQSGTLMRLFFTFYRDFVCMFMCALARACVRASVCARMRVCTLACVCMCARERERTAIFYQISLLSFEMQDVLSFSICDFFSYCELCQKIFHLCIFTFFESAATYIDVMYD